MSYWVRVLCRRNYPPSRRQVAGWVRSIKQKVAPDLNVEFSPDFDNLPQDEVGWDELQIYFDRSKRPVVLSLDVGESVSAAKLNELRELIQAGQSRKKKLVLSYIDGCSMLFTAGLNQSSLPQPIRTMLKCLEASMACENDGIIYVPDEAIYDCVRKKLMDLG